MAPLRRPLLGRDADLDALRAALEAGPIVTIAGAPGIGKSALAAEFADAPLVRIGGRKLVPRWIDLEGVASPEALAGRILAALDGAPTSHGASLTVAARRLADAKLLAVFDDADDVLEPLAELLDRWRPSRTESLALVTAGRPLPHSRARVVRLRPLPLPSSELEPLADEPSIALVLGELQRADFGARAFTSAELAAASVIARHLDGVPASLLLAGATASRIGLFELARELESGAELELSTADVDVPPRQRSLQALAQRALAHLSVDERRVAGALATLEGSFAAPIASAVSGEPDGIEALLAKLDAEGLTEPSPSLAGLRHAMLAHVRVAALAELSENARRVARRAKVLHWARHPAHEGWVVVRADPRSRPDRPARTAAYLDAVALEMNDEALSLFVSIAPAYLAEGPLEPLLELAGRSESLHLEREGRGTIAFFRAMALLFLGRPKEALAAFADAERDAPAPLAALSISQRGVIFALGGDFRRGWAACRKAEGRLRGAPPEIVGRVFKNAATVLSERGSSLALDYLLRAESCFRRSGDAREEAFVKLLRLTHLTDDGDLDGAAKLAPRTLAELDAVGDRRSLAWARAVVAILDQERGAFGRAREQFAKALEGALAVGDTHTAGLIHYYVARLDLEQGDLGAVLDRSTEARPLLERDPGHLALVEATLAWAHRLAGRAPAARAAAARALALVGDRGREARRLAVRAMVAIAHGKPPPIRARTVSGEELRFVARVFDRALEPKAPERILEIAEDGAWIAFGERPLSLADAPMLKKLVALLAATREKRPGEIATASELGRRLWPGTRFDDDKKNRLYVAFARLRKLGLDGVLERTGGGYRFDPEIPFRRVTRA